MTLNHGVAAVGPCPPETTAFRLELVCPGCGEDQSVLAAGRRHHHQSEAVRDHAFHVEEARAGCGASAWGLLERRQR